MPRFDLSPVQLESYRPDVREPADFDTFWNATIAAARAAGGSVVVEKVASPLTVFDVFDITFPGFAGDPVKAWFITPAGSQGPLPTVVEFLGYGGGRGLPSEHLQWPAAGYSYMLMDTRGQGSVWSAGGVTPDPYGSGPAVPGFMTRGIESPEDYYYRRVFTDAVRAVDAARTLPQVDPARVAICGASQGGGITLAAAALCDGLVAAMPDVPYLCHFERAIELADRSPYQEVVQYLAVHRGAQKRVLDTLSYFDGANFAARAKVPAMFSVALMDQICPPSTVYAAYNRYAGRSEITIYPYNEHEGGQAHQWVVQQEFLRSLV